MTLFTYDDAYRLGPPSVRTRHAFIPTTGQPKLTRTYVLSTIGLYGRLSRRHISAARVGASSVAAQNTLISRKMLMLSPV